MGQSMGELEQLVLLALLRLGNEGYGIAVQREIEAKAKRVITLGAIYSTLARLEDKGFLASRVGDGRPQGSLGARSGFDIAVCQSQLDE